MIHHTDCGMQTFTNEELRARLARGAMVEISDIDVDSLPFTDLDQSVRDDVRRIERSSYLDADLVVTGWVYDTKSGRLRPVTL